ncbi:MAG: EutN/CcmL family microcompartment protein [Pseudomonadota bacterium]
MFLARVKGHIVSSAKDPSLTGSRMVVVEPLKIDYADPKVAANSGAGDTSGGRFEPTGRAIVAIDRFGAGEGQLVLIVQGSSARMAEGCDRMPTDAAVVGIVDEAQVMGRRYTAAQTEGDHS